MHTSPLPPILVVEDSPEDFVAISRAFKRNGLQHPLRRFADGDDAIAFLDELTANPTALLPALVLLDLNMPGTDGRAVLKEIKQNERLQVMPTIVFSTSARTQDVDDCYQLGVNSYLVKPLDFNVLEEHIRRLMQFWLDTAVLPSKH